MSLQHTAITVSNTNYVLHQDFITHAQKPADFLLAIQHLMTLSVCLLIGKGKCIYIVPLL